MTVAQAVSAGLSASSCQGYRQFMSLSATVKGDLMTKEHGDANDGHAERRRAEAMPSAEELLETQRKEAEKAAKQRAKDQDGGGQDA
jgi:hypothetical protein